MIRSSIDLGTNTCLLLIADCDEQGVRQVRADYSTVVRLGQGVDQNHTLHPEAMARTLGCLQTYAQYLREAGLRTDEAVCVATSQARDANNGAEFFKQVEEQTGFRFQVISGETEARLTFVGGLLPGMAAQNSAVIDIGGGSTEIISIRGGQSLDIGAVRFTERFLKSDPVTDQEFWACQKAIDEKLAPWVNVLGQGTTPCHWVGVAGTATTLAAWFLELPKFDARAIDGLTLSRGDVHRLVEELKWRTVHERTFLPGVEKGRADVLLAGAMILWRTMELLSIAKIGISTRGLRFGTLSQGAF